MEHIEIDNNIVNEIPEQFRTELIRLGYPIPYSGTKYGYIYGILNRYIEVNINNNDNPNENFVFNVRNSSTWGLAKAYIMYLRATDRTDQIDEIYIDNTPLTPEEVQYVSGRSGVVIYNNNDDDNIMSFGIRDFIRLIGQNELTEFTNWMLNYR